MRGVIQETILRVFTCDVFFGSGETDFSPPGGQHKVDRIENGRLARAVVSQKEQMPALGNLNRRRPEVVELHNPHGGYPV